MLAPPLVVVMPLPKALPFGNQSQDKLEILFFMEVLESFVEFQVC